jgi:hypothetical protein
MPMREIWLQGNRRAILFGAILPGVFVLAGFAMFGAALNRHEAVMLRWCGVAAIILGMLFLAILAGQYRRPRIAFEKAHVLFFVRSGEPIAVPVDIVEAFLVGEGPAHLPGIRNQPKTVNLVARLSQRHTEWARQSVKPAIANWCDGYVTMRGTWCEPLNHDVIRRLNRRLKEVKEQSNHA